MATNVVNVVDVDVAVYRAAQRGIADSWDRIAAHAAAAGLRDVAKTATKAAQNARFRAGGGK